MKRLKQLIDTGTVVADHRPWPRAVVPPESWQRAGVMLGRGEISLLGLWGDEGAVHMALLEREAEPGETGIAVISVACRDGRFPGIGVQHAPAIRLERSVTDLFGHVPEDAADPRPWLDHGEWLAGPSHPEPYAFLPAEGSGLHQIAVGPVHAGIIEPGHFRFSVHGETIVRLEARLGYTHKGIEALMAGKDMDGAMRIAGRSIGDSTVAYSLALARAIEAALGVGIPERAVRLRALMAELERLANHLGDIGAICNDASFAILHAHTGILREQVLRANDTAFGHRLLRDCIVAGGVARDLTPAAAQAITDVVAEVRRRLPAIVDLYDNTASLQDRTVDAGRLAPALATQFAAGGYVGRASGRAFDTRRDLPYPPYDQLEFSVPVRTEGDVNARVWIRIEEAIQSLSLIEQCLASLPSGPCRVEMVPQGGEGIALVEGFRGDVLASVRLGSDGRVERCHLRDPSWFQWPLLETAIAGNIVADFPLCNKSFNCAYSGTDL